MDFLKKLHPDIRDNDICLDEINHIYNIKGNQNYTSVTTFVKSLFEEFNDNKIIQNMMNSKNWPKNKYFGMTKFVASLIGLNNSTRSISNHGYIF